MKKMKKLVVGNWKMNPSTVLEAKKIVSAIKKGVKKIKKTQIVMCPPYIYLSPLSSFVSNSVLLGAQNSFYEQFGAFTGEVSFSQLHQFGVSFVIVGHSERRVMGETDKIINKKVHSIVGEGMTAVLCVGEQTRDIHGDYLSFVREQILSGTKDISKKLIDHIVIAYEPLWAIGAKTAMTSSDIHEMYIFIKKVLLEEYGPLADSVKILYGGAVNPENAEDIIKNGFVNGLLVGRDSINAVNFLEIIRLVENVR